ncbi:MAG: DUF5658 family protein [Planctomycetota bacterium]
MLTPSSVINQPAEHRARAVGMSHPLAQFTHAATTLGRLERPRRVLYLLAAVVLMSAADLAITLVWLTNVGLAESNPLARWVIAQGSVELLAVWKAITVLPAVLVFAVLRDKPVGELGAIIAATVLAIVTLHWHAYHADADLLVHALPAFEQGTDERWITLVSSEPSIRPTPANELATPSATTPTSAYETLAASATLGP